MEIIDIRHDGNVTIIEPLKARIDASLAVKFKNDVSQIISENDGRIVLNLSNVDFIDSSGLGAIVSLMKSLGGSGNISICNMKDPVMGVFKLTRMDKIFSIYPNEEAALSHFHN
jgi:anti-sigma B factor antagonist